MRNGWIGVLWIIAGIVVLAWPDVIRWTLGIGVIVIGVIQLLLIQRD